MHRFTILSIRAVTPIFGKVSFKPWEASPGAGRFLRAFLRLPRRCQPAQVEVPHYRRDRAFRLDSLYLLLMYSYHLLAFATALGRHK
jgi:hypothetical protein